MWSYTEKKNSKFVAFFGDFIHIIDTRLYVSFRTLYTYLPWP